MPGFEPRTTASITIQTLANEQHPVQNRITKFNVLHFLNGCDLQVSDVFDLKFCFNWRISFKLNFLVRYHPVYVDFALRQLITSPCPISANKLAQESRLKRL